MYTRILVPTDGSALAQRGVDHGLAIARIMGASVIAVTVSEPWSQSGLAEAVGFAGEQDLIGQLVEGQALHADEILNAVKTQAEAFGVACECVHVTDRWPAQGILETAADKQASLIVMASHGRRGVARLLLGSQTLDVVSHSQLPVLIVK